MQNKIKRVINPQRYLFALHPGDQFYITAPLLDEDVQHLVQYGITPDGPARIPVPRQSATRVNTNGKWVIHRNLPKEKRAFVHAYHIIDWHGEDHYGTCVQHRMCYQRELIPPTDLAFMVENGVLYSPLLENCEDAMTVVKAVMNIVLEMIGHFEICTIEKTPALPPVKQYEVPWEILRSGTRDHKALESYIEKTVEHKSKAQQVAIYSRHSHLQRYEPDFYVLGSQNFFGYVVYGFPRFNLFVFESNEVNNATYMFRGDWEQASRLTKMEVLSGCLQEARVYHTEQWEENISHLIYRFSKEAV
jgi:hypothetical protein